MAATLHQLMEQRTACLIADNVFVDVAYAIARERDTLAADYARLATVVATLHGHLDYALAECARLAAVLQAAKKPPAAVSPVTTPCTRGP